MQATGYAIIDNGTLVLNLSERPLGISSRDGIHYIFGWLARNNLRERKETERVLKASLPTKEIINGMNETPVRIVHVHLPGTVNPSAEVKSTIRATVNDWIANCFEADVLALFFEFEYHS